MGTSVHIPKPLLDAVDRRARVLRISRNRLVLRALEREVAEGADWSEGFFESMQADDATRAAIDEMNAAIRAGRTAKRATVW